MQTVIEHIFDALGEATAMSTALGEPVQTVHSWKANGNIPRWWRPHLLRLKPVEGKALSQDALAYLASRERKPRIAA